MRLNTIIRVGNSPFFIFCCGLVISVSVYLHLIQRFEASILAKLKIELNARESKTKLIVSEEVSSLERMSNLWSANNGFTKKVWEADAKNYVNDLDGLQALEWVDKTNHVRWIVPLKGNEAALNLDLGFEKKRRDALLKSRQEKKFIISKPVDLVQGGRGVLIYYPLYINQEKDFDGFILAVLKLKVLLESKKVADDNFKLRYILKGDDNKYSMSKYCVKENFVLLGESYKAILSPQKAWIEAQSKHDHSHNFLFFGILISGFVSYIKVGQKRALELRKQIEENAKSKSLFLANMSHEVRTPMNAILGFSEMLLESDLSDENKGNVNMIKNSSESLLVVVNDILDFSKLEVNKLQLEYLPFDLKAHLIELKDTISQEPLVAERGLDVIVDLPEEDCFVVGDKYRIRQVLLNLLNNAIKFTEDGFVNLKLKTQRYDEMIDIVIDVEDSGIGIAKDKVVLVFEKFTQSDISDTRKYGGTGLGLSISRSLVELMEGTLTVSSEEGKGSTFSVKMKLPIHQGGDIETEKKTLKCPQKYHGKALIVEDNLVNQKLISKTLIKLGLDVDIVGNGFQAVKKVESKKYDLVLMDLQMPVMGGIEATIKIREFNMETPIVALTANVVGNISEKCFEAGMNDFMTKPLKKKFLLKVLDKYLENNKVF